MTKKLLTIIVPSYNEAENLTPLMERIDNAMRKASIPYSVVVVDDRSTDNTIEITNKLSKKYPLSVLRKKDTIERGKASSLIAGFSYAKTELVTMIDADLQYPPEAIPEMVAIIQKGQADVVVARRSKRRIGVLRDTASYVYRSIFGSLLFKLPYDIQSGLKVFKREILERITLSPSNQWMLDLELLLQARDGGYTIASHDISFAARAHGTAKIHLVRASLEMAIAALALKLKETQVVHFKDGFHYKGQPFVHYTGLKSQESALKQVTKSQLLVLIWAAALIIFCFLANWQLAVICIVAAMTGLYFLDLLFSAFLVYKSFTNDYEITSTPEEIKVHPDSYWPTYTIFCPLYKEWHVLPQFIRAMSQLDYPRAKLQVMLLLEEDDKESIEHVSTMKLPSFFTVKVVPHSKPKTKPKALNYGLQYATGEFAVIYDAEDIPDPQQLKKTVLAFKKSPATVVCIQAKLNFYNPHQNLLTRLFTAEYSLWFDLVLPGLQSVGAPIPLGGTSNHFRVADLKKLNGWDAFNVTEDCDLGMRLAKNGFKTAIVNSTTMEEANSRVFNWYGQRSRWIKGYIQTYLVHMRDIGKFSRTRAKPDAYTFQLVVGGKILCMFVNPFMWLITISYFAFRPTLGPIIETFYPAPILYMGVLCLVIGNFLYMYSYMIGCVKRGYFELIKFALFTPIYWLAMSIAAWRAMYEIVIKPHYWSKTVHGFHLAPAKKHHSKEKKQSTFEHVLGGYVGPADKNPKSSVLPEYCDILTKQYSFGS